MSIYPRFNTGSTFNAKDIISYDEQESGQTIVSLDLSSFIQKSAPVFENELYLKDGVGINMNGTKQSTAFTDNLKTDLETSKNKLTSIQFADNKTTVSNEFDLTGASVTLSDNQIAQSKITGLVNRLTEIDTNLANINSNDTDIANLNSTTATHTSQLSDIESKNTTQDASISALETDTENITIRVTDLEDDVSNLETKDTEHDASLNTLFSLTTTLTNDVVGLISMDTDISANLSTYKISNDASVVSINTDISTIQGVDVTQNNRLDAIETLNSTQDGRLDAVETLNSTQDGRLDAVETKNVTQDGRLDAVETLTVNHTADLSNLNALQSANIYNITTLQGENVTQSSQISTLETQILTKHSTINNTNKLNVAYLGNGDVSNAKLSALNDVRTDVSIQNQINTINESISGLDALQDLDIVNIPILQSDVANLKAKDVTVDASLNTLFGSTVTNANGIAANVSSIAVNVASINTTNTNVNNNANSISTINSNVAALVSADGIHDTQITDLQNADTVLQANIDLKENIISLTNKLDSTKIFDTTLNDSLDAILSTIDSNISILNSSKQNNITTLSKLNSSLLNRNDNLQYIDITGSLQTQLTNINNAITTLQGVTSNDTILSFQTIEDNFDTLEANKLNKSVYDDTIAPDLININNAISTLQGLQDGDVVSFNSINNSITNLTNTKHPLITSGAKLDSSLLNRDDNLQHIDITSSLQNKLNSLDTDILTKNNVISGTNKLNSSFLDLSTTNLQYADYSSSISSKLGSIDSQITALSNTDVAQTTTNTNLQNQINTNATAINDLETFETAQGVTNTNLQNNIDNIDLSSKQDVLTNASSVAHVDITAPLQASLNTLQGNIDTIDLSSKQDVLINASSVAHVDITSGLQASLNTLQSNIDTIDLSSKQDVLTNASSVAFVDITSGLQSSLNTLQNNIDTITPEQTLNDMFYNFKANMPTIPNSKTVMNFTIDSENYQATQSSYYGVHSSGSQTDSWSMQNLFDTDEASLFRIGYKNNWFYNESDVLVKYENYQFDVNGDYVGALSQQDANTLTNYTGEFIEFQNPFYFKPTSVYFKANLSGQSILKTYVMGSNDNSNYELIDTIDVAAAEETTYNFTTTDKYKTLKFIFNKAATQLGITLKTMTLAGVKSASLITDTEQIVLNTASIATNVTNIQNNLNSIGTINTNVTTLTNADTTHSSQISALQTQDGVLQSNIDGKHNLIDINNKLASNLVTGLDTSLSTITNDITDLQNDKQNVIDVNNKVAITNVDLTGSNLIYADFGSSINSKMTALDGQISTLTGLQNGDTANFTAIDASLVDLYAVKQDLLNDTTNKLAISKVDLTGSSLANMDFGSSVDAKMTALDGQISTLTGLQNGDTANFTVIDASLVDLYAVKQDLLNDTTNKLAISKVDLTGSSLANMDFGSSVDAKMTALDGAIANKNNIIDVNNKLNSAHLDLTTTNLQYADFGSSINDKMTALDGQISTLTATDSSQATQNTSFTNLINTANSNIDLKQDIIDVNNKVAIANVDLTGSNLINMDYSTGSLTTKLNLLQTNIDNVSSKTETYGTTNYNPSVNVITHTFDEKNLFIDPLDDNNLMELDLTLTSPTDLKNYKQVLVINALEFKSYVNVLKINGTVTEMKHRDGDTNINLAPIAGYSMITQTLDLSRIGGEWYVMSNIDLFYNSASNTVYDVTPPVITVLGDAVVNHEINSGAYTDAGATATDNIDGDMTGSIVVSGDTVDVAVLGVYNIYYNVSDGIPNAAIQKSRIVNVVDTINPVVTLTGDAVITIFLNATYTELGATASDNSNESLTVVITGAVDNTTLGDYNLTYTATDSTGNSHAIGRLIHVVSDGYTFQYYNPATDIFDLMDAFTHCTTAPLNTYNLATVSTGFTYLHGDYKYYTGSVQNNSSHMRYAFDDTNTIYASMTDTQSGGGDTHLYAGNMTGFTAGDYPYDRWGTNLYNGVQMNNGSYNGLVYFAHQDSVTTTNYDGEFLEVIMPFYIELTSMYIQYYTTTFSPAQSVLMGSTDGGVTYQMIEVYNNPGLSHTPTYTANTKYNAFKLIATELTTGGYVFAVAKWKCFGKIYT